MTTPADNLLAAMDAYVDGRIEPKLQALLDATKQGMLYLADEVDLLRARLDAIAPQPAPEPVPPTSGLSVRDGVFMRNGERFTAFSVNLAGNAVTSTSRAQRREMFDRLKDTGCEIVRFLHIARDNPDDRISQYQPTIAEWLGGLNLIEECLDDLADRNMLAWLTVQHRQRYEYADELSQEMAAFLFSPRPAGIYQGEIDYGFLWFPHLESAVESFCGTVAGRFKSHPALGLLSIANEKLAVRSPGYWVGARGQQDQSVYQRAWFKKLDEYQALTGLTDKDMDKVAIAQFQSWVGVSCYKRLEKFLRDCGVTCPIGSTALFGDSSMSALPEASCLDYAEVHVYPSSTPGLSDPFLMNGERTIASVANACRVVGKPLCLGEYAGVHEGRKERLPSWYEAPLAVARAGFDISTYYAAWLGKPGNNGLYDAFDDTEFVERFKAATADYSRKPIGEKYLADWEVFGQKVGSTYQPPPVPGVQPWSKEVGGVVLPELGWM